MNDIPSTPAGLTRAKADARYPLLVDVASTPGASKIPRAGVDGKLAAGWLPDLSGTYAAVVHNHDDRYYTESEITALLTGYQVAGSYAPLVHTHAAADVVSGVLANARVNWAAPSAIGGTTPAAITGTALAGTSLSIAPDTDASTVLGRTRIDSRTTDQATFSHYDMASAVQYALRQTAAGQTTISCPAGREVLIAQNGTNYALFDSVGLLLGTSVATSGSARLHVREVDAATNAVTNVAIFGHNSSGTPAAGFGAGQLFQMETSTTENRTAAAVEAIWQTATDASRAADLVLSAYNVTNKREGVRIRGGASGAELAFFGGTPAAKPSLGTWAGLTTDQKLDALRDALNTLSLASYS